MKTQDTELNSNSDSMKGHGLSFPEYLKSLLICVSCASLSTPPGGVSGVQDQRLHLGPTAWAFGGELFVSRACREVQDTARRDLGDPGQAGAGGT